MTLQKFLTIVFLLLTGQIYAQEFSPDELTPIDKERVQQIQKEMDEINKMLLVGDTLVLAFNESLDIIRDLSVLYFDRQWKLRKYGEKYSGESEGGLTVAYYNTNGDIIFYEFDGGSHCDNTKEHYFIHEGRILDGNYDYSCGCCTDEDDNWLDADITKRVTDTPFVEIIEEYREWKAYFLRTESLLDYTSEYFYKTAEFQLLPGTFPRKKADQFANRTITYYDNLTAKAFGTQVEILDSIDHPKAYFLRIGYSLYSTDLIAVKKDSQYAVFKILNNVGFEFNIERLNIDGIGNDELIIRKIPRIDETERRERAGYDFGNFEERGYIEVWDLDSLSCLLSIQYKYMYNRWRYDFSGNVLEQWSNCKALDVSLDEKQLTIQKVKNCNEGILGLSYKYRLTESGFVLDSVE